MFYRRPKSIEEEVSRRVSAVGVTYWGWDQTVRPQKRDIWALLGHSEGIAEDGSCPHWDWKSKDGYTQQAVCPTHVGCRDKTSSSRLLKKQKNVPYIVLGAKVKFRVPTWGPLSQWQAICFSSHPHRQKMGDRIPWPLFS